MTTPDDEEPVPKLPRGRFLTRMQMRDIFAILMLLTTLIAVLALRRGCAEGVGNLFRAFEPPVDAGAGRRLPPSAVPLAPREERSRPDAR